MDFSKKKKRKLKNWVKIALFIIVMFLLIQLIKYNNIEYKKIANKCDQDHGFTCSYYQVRQYQNRY